MAQEKQLMELEGWIARNDFALRHNELMLFFEKPTRDRNYGWKSSRPSILLPNWKFRDVKWTDEPVKVEIIIKKN